MIYWKFDSDRVTVMDRGIKINTRKGGGRGQGDMYGRPKRGAKIMNPR